MCVRTAETVDKHIRECANKSSNWHGSVVMRSSRESCFFLNPSHSRHLEATLVLVGRATGPLSSVGPQLVRMLLFSQRRVA